jgi:hypothetical protein
MHVSCRRKRAHNAMGTLLPLGATVALGSALLVSSLSLLTARMRKLLTLATPLVDRIDQRVLVDKGAALFDLFSQLRAFFSQPLNRR